jgi:hypothetical protein
MITLCDLTLAAADASLRLSLHCQFEHFFFFAAQQSKNAM